MHQDRTYCRLAGVTPQSSLQLSDLPIVMHMHSKFSLESRDCELRRRSDSEIGPSSSSSSTAQVVVASSVGIVEILGFGALLSRLSLVPLPSHSQDNVILFTLSS